jgi:predicted transcriptional regulator
MSLLHPKIVIERLLARGMTQETIATLSGTTQPTICRIQKGEVADPRWSQVYGLHVLYQAILDAEAARKEAA